MEQVVEAPDVGTAMPTNALGRMRVGRRLLAIVDVVEAGVVVDAAAVIGRLIAAAAAKGRRVVNRRGGTSTGAAACASAAQGARPFPHSILLRRNGCRMYLVVVVA